MSSLSQQLGQLSKELLPLSLSAPTSTVSLIFPANTAGDASIAAVRTLAVAGLNSLAQLHPPFNEFAETLFSADSVDFDRRLVSPELVDQLSHSISRFLAMLSPYVQVPASWKTIEYLLRRYQVHIYHVNEMIGCILPFHTTGVFGRILGTLKLEGTTWSWLKQAQGSKSGVDRRAVVTHAAQNKGFLEWMVMEVAKTEREKVNAKQKIDLLTAVAVELIEKEGAWIKEDTVITLVNIILEGLRSDRKTLKSDPHALPGEFLAGALMILCALVSRTQFDKIKLQSLLEEVAKATLPRTYQATADVTPYAYNKNNNNIGTGSNQPLLSNSTEDFSVVSGVGSGRGAATAAAFAGIAGMNAGTSDVPVGLTPRVLIGVRAMAFLCQSQNAETLPGPVLEALCNIEALPDMLVWLAEKHNISVLVDLILIQLGSIVVSREIRDHEKDNRRPENFYSKLLIEICTGSSTLPVAPSMPKLISTMLKGYFASPANARTSAARSTLVSFLRCIEQIMPSAAEHGIRKFLRKSDQDISREAYDIISAAFVDPRLLSLDKSSDMTVALSLVHPDSELRLLSLTRVRDVLAQHTAEFRTADPAEEDRIRRARAFIGESLQERLADSDPRVAQKAAEILAAPEAEGVVPSDDLVDLVISLLAHSSSTEEGVKAVLAKFLLEHLIFIASPAKIDAILAAMLDHLVSSPGLHIVSSTVHQLIAAFPLQRLAQLLHSDLPAGTSSASAASTPTLKGKGSNSSRKEKQDGRSSLPAGGVNPRISLLARLQLVIQQNQGQSNSSNSNNNNNQTPASAKSSAKKSKATPAPEPAPEPEASSKGDEYGQRIAASVKFIQDIASSLAQLNPESSAIISLLTSLGFPDFPTSLHLRTRFALMVLAEALGRASSRESAAVIAPALWKLLSACEGTVSASTFGEPVAEWNSDALTLLVRAAGKTFMPCPLDRTFFSIVALVLASHASAPESLVSSNATFTQLWWPLFAALLRHVTSSRAALRALLHRLVAIDGSYKWLARAWCLDQAASNCNDQATAQALYLFASYLGTQQSSNSNNNNKHHSASVDFLAFVPSLVAVLSTSAADVRKAAITCIALIASRFSTTASSSSTSATTPSGKSKGKSAQPSADAQQAPAADPALAPLLPFARALVAAREHIQSSAVFSRRALARILSTDGRAFEPQLAKDQNASAEQLTFETGSQASLELDQPARAAALRVLLTAVQKHDADLGSQSSTTFIHLLELLKLTRNPEIISTLYSSVIAPHLKSAAAVSASVGTIIAEALPHFADPESAESKKSGYNEQTFGFLLEVLASETADAAGALPLKVHALQRFNNEVFTQLSGDQQTRFLHALLWHPSGQPHSEMLLAIHRTLGALQLSAESIVALLENASQNLAAASASAAATGTTATDAAGTTPSRKKTPTKQTAASAGGIDLRAAAVRVHKYASVAESLLVVVNARIEHLGSLLPKILEILGHLVALSRAVSAAAATSGSHAKENSSLGNMLVDDDDNDDEMNGGSRAESSAVAAIDVKTVEYVMQLTLQLFTLAAPHLTPIVGDQSSQQQQQASSTETTPKVAARGRSRKSVSGTPGKDGAALLELDLAPLVHVITNASGAETQSRAILALATLARERPALVLANLEPVLDSLGSTLLVRDDIFSNNALMETIRSIIPVISVGGTHGASTGRSSGPALDAVLDVFVSALPNIAERRRLVVFSTLLQTVGPSHLGELSSRILALHCRLMDEFNQENSKKTKKTKKGSSAMDIDSDQDSNDDEKSAASSAAGVEELDAARESRALANINDLLSLHRELTLLVSPFDQLEAFVGMLESLGESNSSSALSGPRSNLYSGNHAWKAFVAQLAASEGGLFEQYRELTVKQITAHLTSLQFKNAWSKLDSAVMQSVIPNVAFITNACLNLLLEFANRERTEQKQSAERKSSIASMRESIQTLLSSANSLLPTKGFVESTTLLMKNSDQLISLQAFNLVLARLNDHGRTRDSELAFFSPMLKVLADFVRRDTYIAQARQKAIQCMQAYAQRLTRTDASAALALVPMLYDPLRGTNLHVAGSAAVSIGLIVASVGPKALEHLNTIFPELIEKLKTCVASEQPPAGFSESDLATVVLCVIDAITDVVRVLAPFLGPYLLDLLSLLFCKKLITSSTPEIKGHDIALVDAIAAAVSPRIILPIIPKLYRGAKDDGETSMVQLFRFLGRVCLALDSDTMIEYKKHIFKFFIAAFDLRRLFPDLGFNIFKVEDAMIEAFCSFCLKLSEKSFLPFFLKVHEWSVVQLPINHGAADASGAGAAAGAAAGSEGQYAVSTTRVVLFYRLVLALAKRFKAIFAPFFSYTLDNSMDYLSLVGDMFGVKNAEATLIRDAAAGGNAAAGDAGASGKKRKRERMLYADYASRCLSEDDFIMSVIDGLHQCFMYASQDFVESRWEKLLPVLMGLYEFNSNKDDAIATLRPSLAGADNSPVDGSLVYRARINSHIIPCVTQLALCVPSELLWKPLNHALLMLTRNDSAHVRFAALKTIQHLFTTLGESYLVLLPETIPFLAELLEDESIEVENLTRDVVKKIEDLSGESLQELLRT